MTSPRSSRPGESAPIEIAGPLVQRIIEMHRSTPSDQILLVGLDGRSGAGKSTLAAAVTRALGTQSMPVLVIEGDQFYAGGSAATWDACDPIAKADRVIDWRRERDVLEDLRRQGHTRFRPFDWDAERWDADEPPLDAPMELRARRIVLLEGAYSCRPELSALLDLRVLLEVPRALRRSRLLAREGAEYRSDWERRWSEAEDHYFSNVAPRGHFDLVIDGG